MKINLLRNVLKVAALLGMCVCVHAQTNVPSTFKHITIDGSFSDWSGVPLAYTAPVGTTNAIQYENVYIANDDSNLYIRFTLYSPRAAFQNSFDNVFIDGDNTVSTGFPVGGIGSSILIQWGGGYQEKNGGFNEGGVDGLGWNIAGSDDSMDYELSISRSATFSSDSTTVFASNTIAILLEGDDTGYANAIFAPPSGGMVYTFATNAPALSGNLSLANLTTSSWQINASGSDLGTNWLAQNYDDTGIGWVAGNGLFGYTPSPGAYPAINTGLSSGPTTYYFRTKFQWTNATADVAFVITNYLSDGAVYYLNGNEIRRVRMSDGAISYATLASSTNISVGQPDVFGVDGAFLLPASSGGTNTLEVETHQAPSSSSDMVFGLSLTASLDYPVFVSSTNLPADHTVVAGDSVTFVSDVIGSGPLAYQWYYNSTNAISGANGPTYTIPMVLTNDTGAYSLRVSNSFSETITRAAFLTVSNIPVVITSEPISQIALEGKSATFSVGVTGTPLIQYQWFLDGNPIIGATNADYTILACYSTNAGVYQVTINNPASTTNSYQVNLSVLKDTIPPNLAAVSASSSQVVITFSEPVDAVTSGNVANYSISGVSVLSATPNPNNAAQVVLTTGTGLAFGTVYTLNVNGVLDLFNNTAHVSGQFIRDITVDGSFDDWSGLAPVYSSTSPSGNLNAADFKDIYVYNDANYYYFRVTLWTDIDSSAGQFPYYVNMFFDTDNNSGTGYAAFGSEMLIQSGYAYQQKDGGTGNGLVDGYGINGLNWLCLPAAAGTNFEFQLSRSATFGEDSTPVFTADQLNFLFQGMTPSFVVENTVPEGGVISYTNTTSVTPASLPLGNLAINALPNGQAAVVWDPPGTLQESSSLINSTWTNLSSATSPYIISIVGTNQFFRLTQ